MPTVHLSLPEQVYRELKDYAAEMGVQVTDLIKMFIREGLERLRKERAARRRQEAERAAELLLQVMKKLEELQRTFEERLALIEGDIYLLQASVHNIKKRLSRLEDTVEEHLMPVEAEIVRP